MRFYRKQATLYSFFLILGFVLIISPKAQASPEKQFTKGWQEFHDLKQDSDRAQYRSYWMKVKEYFSKAYKQSPKGPYAPKSLYYLGRAYAELGKRSYLKSDFKQAVNYYQKMVDQFPEHGWADDCKLRKAKILLSRLGEKKEAYQDVLFIVRNYKNEDMYQQAQELLKKMDLKDSPSEFSKKEKKRSLPETQATESSRVNTLQGVRFADRQEFTRVVIDLKDKAKFEQHLLKANDKLDKPPRLFFDLYQTRLGPEVEDSISVQRKSVLRVRTGQFRKNRSRVVLDMRDLGDYEIFTLPEPFRIVVDVYPPGKNAPQKGRSTKKKALIDQLGLGIHTVMIDPGHGGKDPGAVNGQVYEKDITLRLAKILGELLQKKGFQIYYTRTKDIFIPLEKRTSMANNKGADLFISVHANANHSPKVKGFELYSLNMAQSKHAARVAARENAISEKKISDLQVILTDLMLDSKIKDSKELADVVHAKALNYVQDFYSINDQGLREAPFYVLMGARMPSILVELGYMSNPQELQRLQSDNYLKRMAKGLVKGIVAYKKENTRKYADYGSR